jgi:hypothetical protein
MRRLAELASYPISRRSQEPDGDNEKRVDFLIKRLAPLVSK